MNAAIFSYLTDTLYFVDSGSIYRHQPFMYPKHDPMGSDNWSNTQVMHLLGRRTGNCTGNKVYWYAGNVGDTKIKLWTFKSTSGYKGPDGNGVFFNLQYAKYQNVKSGGPTPEGKYYINLQPSPDRHPKAVKDGKGYALTPTKEGGIESVGIMWVDEEQTIARDFRGSRGNFRARLEPEKGSNTQGRYDFYFHDSEKGYSSGCHEFETGLFDKLLEYRKNNPDEKDIKVIVKYPGGPEQSTNGGTEKKKPAKASTGSH